MRQNLQGEIDKSTIIVGDFNTTLLEMNRYRRQKSSKDIGEFNTTTNQLDVMDTYRLFHPIRLQEITH